MNWIDVCGWLGAIGFSLCCFPQAWQSYKQQHSRGITWGLLGLWIWGEIFTLVAVVASNGAGYLIVNYVANLICLLVIMGYKIQDGK